MGDSDESNAQASLVPSWQQVAAEDSGSQTPSSESIADRARRFLQDEEVKNSSTDKKIEFLKSKGLEGADINRLLEESSRTTVQPTTTKTTETQISGPELREIQVSPPEAKPDQPPIITYPEFLTKPAKPPPLITASGLVNSLGLVAGFSTLVYGATKHIVSPMVDALNEARIDFYQNTNKNLTQLVEKLEQTVSELPANYHNTAGKRTTASAAAAGEKQGGDDDDDENDSDYDDPSEMFHRDVGVQTSPLAPPSPSSATSASGLGHGHGHGYTSSSSSPSAEQAQHHTDRLDRLSVGVRNLATDVIRQAEDLAQTKTVLDLFGSDLHALTYPPESFGMGSTYLYGSQRSEPDDEIKRVKQSIRGVKGVLLSTRSFPATTR